MQTEKTIHNFKNTINRLGNFLNDTLTLGNNIYEDYVNVSDKVSKIPLPTMNVVKDKNIRKDYFENKINPLIDNVISSFDNLSEGLDNMLNYFPTLNSEDVKRPNNGQPKIIPMNKKKINQEKTIKPIISKGNKFYGPVKTKQDIVQDDVISPVVKEDVYREKNNNLSSFPKVCARYGMFPRKRWLRKKNKPSYSNLVEGLQNKSMTQSKKYTSLDDAIANNNTSQTVNKSYSTINEKVSNTKYDTKTIAENNSVLKKLTSSYKSNIDYVVNNYSGVAKDVAEIVSGRSKYNVNGTKKTAWKWSERFKILNDYLDNKISERQDSEGMEAIVGTLESNKYMKRKHAKKYSALKKKITKAKRNYDGKNK